MNVQHGIIKSLDFKGAQLSTQMQEAMLAALLEQKLQDVRNWSSFLQNSLGRLDGPALSMAQRLDELLPVPRITSS